MTQQNQNRWRGPAGLLAASVGLVAAGRAFQALTDMLATQQNPPLGEHITVGGHRVHYHVAGEGSPTVVFEAGLGSGVLGWTLVQPEVAKATRTFSYDRPGIGYSDYVGRPHNAVNVARWLYRVLRAADVPGPYIIVGHSIGGIHARTFAALYPDEVIGVVLVDSSHENQDARLPIGGDDEPSLRDRLTTWLRPVLAEYMLRALRIEPPVDIPSHLTPKQRWQVKAAASRPDFWRALDAERRMATQDTTQPSSPESLGDTPLVVLTAGKPKFDGKPEVDTAWAELQKELVALSSNGTQITDADSGHNIHLQNPQLVVDSILSLIGGGEAAS